MFVVNVLRSLICISVPLPLTTGIILSSTAGNFFVSGARNISFLQSKNLVSKRTLSTCTTVRMRGGSSGSNDRNMESSLLSQLQPSKRQPFVPPMKMKGIFVGSGSDGMADERIVRAILELTTSNDAGFHDQSNNRKQSYSNINVLYIGTATYDLPKYRENQTKRFLEFGCQVSTINLVGSNDEIGTSSSPPIMDLDEMKLLMDAAHVIVVSGGNTLYAIDKWNNVGLDKLIYDAMNRGVVLTGGSAGAICWFQGGHSDSMDPETYKSAMVSKGNHVSEDDSNDRNEPCKEWNYIRVDGLGLLPGLVCPHFDKTQSNGVARSVDFDSMLLKRHSGELGIGIDHWAALVIHGEKYRVISLPGKPGSVMISQSSDAGGERVVTQSLSQEGTPGIWIKEVKDGTICSTLCPKEGYVKDLLFVTPADAISKDPLADKCRRENI
mmetsp:Transcript_8625/g.10112  ORF Transcript_8625/g.10112 Transcript_8625/m.10112 type:complete len:439 (-) Transcript_8625:181-1497(-)